MGSGRKAEEVLGPRGRGGEGRGMGQGDKEANVMRPSLQGWP